MLKQTFDLNAISKVLTSEDVWRWDIWNKIEDKEVALEDLERIIQRKDFKISPLTCQIRRGKPTYQASNIEDVILIRLLDRYIRRIYKVRQSDRNKIIKQVKTVLKDSGNYKILRLDIKNCYESMNFETIIKKLSYKMILSPSCITLLNSILDYCKGLGLNGLPRGLAISPTLAELYLEPIDKYIKCTTGVIYATRYVDDFFILVDDAKADDFLTNLECKLHKIGLNLNEESNKRYIGISKPAKFDYLGYAISVKPGGKYGNNVDLTISNQKLNKIKQKIAISLNDHRKLPDMSILQQRLFYLTVLKVIKKNDNGVLLGGLAYNYRHVSDGFNCLKIIDGFLIRLLNNTRFSLNQSEISVLSKTSFYGFVKNKKKGRFTLKKAVKISRVWKDA